MLDLESTIPDGRLAEQTETLRTEPATAQLELGLGQSLAISIKKRTIHRGLASN